MRVLRHHRALWASRALKRAQMLAELQTLYDLGWRRSVFMVDDNSSATSVMSSSCCVNSDPGWQPAYPLPPLD